MSPAASMAAIVASVVAALAHVSYGAVLLPLTLST
jgi:hypothetical protein